MMTTPKAAVASAITDAIDAGAIVALQPATLASLDELIGQTEARIKAASAASQHAHRYEALLAAAERANINLANAAAKAITAFKALGAKVRPQAPD